MVSERYEILEKLGSGAFAEVFRVKDIETGQFRALKRLRACDPKLQDSLPATHFQEIQALQQLEHPNIIKIFDVLADGAYVSLVLEYMETDLYRIIHHTNDHFSEPTIRGIMQMILHGVAFCHEHNILHRDIKPANLLVDAEGVVKLSDFGLATVYVGPTKSYSHQVATRWYRAPEILFGSRRYDASTDLWSVGTILAELLVNVPVFPGQNDIDQIYRVLQLLGSPEQTWPEVKDLPDYNKVSFQACKPVPLAMVFQDASDQAIDLLSQLLQWDPSKRLTARQALAHPFFFSGPIQSRICLQDYPDALHGARRKRRSSFDEVLESLGKPIHLPPRDQPELDNDASGGERRREDEERDEADENDKSKERGHRGTGQDEKNEAL